MVLLVLCRVLNFIIRRQRLRRQNERENVRKRRRPQHVGDYVEEEGYTRLQVRRIAGNTDSGLTFLGNVEHIPGTVMSQNFLRRFGLSRNDFENLVNLARQSRIEVEPGVFKSRFVDDLNGMRRRPKPIPLHHKIAATICSLRDGARLSRSSRRISSRNPCSTDFFTSSRSGYRPICSRNTCFFLELLRREML